MSELQKFDSIDAFIKDAFAKKGLEVTSITLEDATDPGNSGIGSTAKKGVITKALEWLFNF